MVQIHKKVMMKKYAVLIALLGILSSANAAMIDLGTTWGSPASPTAELNRLNNQIGLWNLSNNPDLTPATTPLWEVTQTQTPEGGTSITLDLSGYNGYLMFKYGPIDRFFYLNDTDQNAPWTLSMASYSGNGLYTFNSDVYDFTGWCGGGLNPAGLSHYTTFNPVPEPATWISGLALLLPFGVSTMRIFRPNLLRN